MENAGQEVGGCLVPLPLMLHLIYHFKLYSISFPALKDGGAYYIVYPNLLGQVEVGHANLYSIICPEGRSMESRSASHLWHK